ncbi:type IX secretion/gliding motility protein PorT/SprT [Polaribacter pacificus]|uniref:type IX secretion/gliding motility protein PorT/SprT n=1 Tax=Polaribacter pacificus TaxID=1775173 RepID=UPI0016695431
MKPVQHIVLLFFLCTNTMLLAQKGRVLHKPTFDQNRLHFGFYLGLNQNDFKIDYKNSSIANPEITTTATTGFNVGLITDLRLHKNFNLRFEPGLISNSKSLTFEHINGTAQKSRTANSTYLHMPLVLKISTNRLDNVRPYLLAGISYDINFTSNENNSNDNAAGEFRTKTNGAMYELGIGVDFYLYYFKFSPSIRGVFALNNELIYDSDPTSQWTSPVNFLGTRGIFLNFSFE